MTLSPNVPAVFDADHIPAPGGIGARAIPLRPAAPEPNGRRKATTIPLSAEQARAEKRRSELIRLAIVRAKAGWPLEPGLPLARLMANSLVAGVKGQDGLTQESFERFAAKMHVSFDEDIADEAISKTLWLVRRKGAAYRLFTNGTAGRWLGVTTDDRLAAKLTTFNPVDETLEERRERQCAERRAADRMRKRLKRLSEGRKPRILYEAESASKQELWKRCGMSRSAWYAAGKPKPEAVPRPLDKCVSPNLIESDCGHTCPGRDEPTGPRASAVRPACPMKAETGSAAVGQTEVLPAAAPDDRAARARSADALDIADVECTDIVSFEQFREEALRLIYGNRPHPSPAPAAAGALKRAASLMRGAGPSEAVPSRVGGAAPEFRAVHQSFEGFRRCE